MITLIGTSTTTIGFGLCGIKDIHEVRRSISHEELTELIVNAKYDVVMIDEDLYEKVKDTLSTDKIIVKIPFRYKEDTGSDDIDELVRDTLGVNITT